MNGDLSPHRAVGSHYPEDGGSLSGGEEVPLVSSSGESGGQFHPGAAHHHTSHSVHHQHHRHQPPQPPASQQPCSLTEDERKYVQMLLSSMPSPKVRKNLSLGSVMCFLLALLHPFTSLSVLFLKYQNEDGRNVMEIVSRHQQTDLC